MQLVIVNGEKIRGAPVFHKHPGLSDKRDQLTPWRVSSQAVLAAQLKWPAGQPAWEMGLLRTREKWPIQTIAVNNGGTVDEVASLPAVRLREDAFVLEFGPQSYGVVWPADRQAAGRWARTKPADGERQLSPYLQTALAYGTEIGTEIVMAVDLTDVSDATNIRERLNSLQSLKQADYDAQQLSRFLAGIRGVTLGIRFTDQITGKIRVDFAESADPLKPFAKPMLLEVLDQFGMRIDELDDWKLELSGNTVYLGGDLDWRSVRRVMSLIDPPAPPLDATSPADSYQSASLPAQSESINKQAQATVNYYQRLKQCIEDLSHPNGNIVTRGSYAMYLERYAKKIDQLPILNVDKELLEFSAEVAMRLRMLANQNRGVGIKSSTYSANSPGGWQYNSAWGGYYATYESRGLSPQQVQRRVETQSAALSESDQREAIANGMASMRRTLTERYQVEF